MAVASNTRQFFLSAIFLICLLPMAIYCFRKPDYNWDMLGYMQIVLTYKYSNTDSLHAATYSIARQELPADKYDQLVNANPYRKKMAEDAASFHTQLPLYSIKPGYTLLVNGLYKAGFPLTKATVIPSIICYLLIGLLVFFWTGKYLSPGFTFLSALLIMYLPFIAAPTSISSPDMLSALVLLAALYFILEKPAFAEMVLCMILSVFVRIDNILTCLGLLALLKFSGKWKESITIGKYALAAAMLIASYFLVTTVITYNSLGGLYYPGFFNYLNEDHTFKTSFSLSAYTDLLYSKLIAGILYSHIILLFLLIALLLTRHHPLRWKTLPLEMQLLLGFIGIIIIRLLLFPDLSDRFYVAFYLATIIVFIKNVKVRIV